MAIYVASDEYTCANRKENIIINNIITNTVICHIGNGNSSSIFQTLSGRLRKIGAASRSRLRLKIEIEENDNFKDDLEDGNGRNGKNYYGKNEGCGPPPLLLILLLR